MLVNLYSIRDIKTDLFEPPFGTQNDQTAKRYFSRIMQQIPTMVQNPADFNLHFVGTLNDSTGELDPTLPVQFIISGLDCVKPIEEAQHVQTQVSNDPSIQPSS